MTARDLVELLLEPYCAPRAKGKGCKLVRPVVDSALVDGLRARALQRDPHADRLAAESLLDPLTRTDLVKELAAGWSMAKAPPDPEWLLRDWVSRYPDDSGLAAGLPRLGQVLTRLGGDFDLALSFEFHARGLAEVLASFARRQPEALAPLGRLLVTLEPDRRQPRQWGYIMGDSLAFMPPAVRLLLPIVSTVVPFLFETGHLQESEVAPLLQRYFGLAEAHPELARWQAWSRGAEWTLLYTSTCGRKAPTGGVQRMLAACAPMGLFNFSDFLLERLPPPTPADEREAAALQAIPDERLLRAAVCAPAWSALLERGAKWPGLGALAGLLWVMQPGRTFNNHLLAVNDWRERTDVDRLRGQVSRLTPARAGLLKTAFPRYEAWYWVEALLGRGRASIVRDVEKGRTRGLLAMALVPPEDRRGCRAALQGYLDALESRSPATRYKGLKLAEFALKWLDPERKDAAWERLEADLLAQLELESKV